MKPTKEQAQAELDRRKTSPFKLEDYLFDKQFAFYSDPNPFRVASCSRRSGKSTEVAAELIDTAYHTPNCTALYVTGTRTDAKKIIWGELLKFNKTYKLGGRANISELTLVFPNGSLVRLQGAKDEAEVEKIRGQLPPVKKVFIDESQSIRDRVLIKLIDDVLEAALLDYAGSISLLGTPGPVPNGYFYRISHNLDEHYNPLPEPVWSTHHWTFFDNPHIAIKSKVTHQAALARVLRRRGVGINDPSIQREYFGKWVQDTDSLVYKYNSKANDYTFLPLEKYNYILGVDLGFDDADALAVLAWSEGGDATYLVEEEVTKKQTISGLVAKIEILRSKYDISKIVVDQGGLGKKIAEEISRRWSITVQAAEKHRKVEYIELMNDALRTGRLKGPVGSRFAQDCMKVEWDRDKSTPDKRVISRRFHSDICEAVLYAWRESYSFTYEKPPIVHQPGTPAWAKQQEDTMFQDEYERLEAIEQALADDPYKDS